MTGQLAEVLSKIDDPATIEKVLELAHTESPSLDSGSEELGHATLSELYERFLARRQNRSPSTISQYKRTIPDFIDFATETGVTTPVAISTKLIDEYVDTLQATYDADATIITYTKNVRAWLRWLNKRGQCRETIYRILDKDELGLTPKARDEALPSSEATAILGKLRQQRRGSLMHALLELLWNGGPRIGGVHSLDLCDFNPDDNEIRLRHRPDVGTRLKNGSEETGTGNGERNVQLKDSVIEAIKQYIKYERPSVTDDFSREPLFATKQGRAARSTLRRRVYEATSCRWAASSLEGSACDGSCDPDTDVCPHSYYPHAIRRGAIVHHLSGGLRIDIASERFDVSIQTLKKHYDPRTKRRRRRDRSDAVRDAWSE